MVETVRTERNESPPAAPSPRAEPTPPARHHRTLFKAAGSSIAGSAAEFAVMSVLVSVLHVFYLLGAVLAWLFYLVVNFLLNHRWAFRQDAGRAGPQLLRNSFVAGGGMALGIPLLWVGVSKIGLPYQIGWIVAGVAAFFLWTYPMHRFFTFRRRRRATLVTA